MTEMIRGGARVVFVGFNGALVEGLEVTADTGGRSAVVDVVVVVVVVGVVVLVVVVVVILICI